MATRLVGMGLYSPTAKQPYIDLVTNATARALWVTTQLEELDKIGGDGIVMDIEGAEIIGSVRPSHPLHTCT